MVAGMSARILLHGILSAVAVATLAEALAMESELRADSPFDE